MPGCLWHSNAPCAQRLSSPAKGNSPAAWFEKEKPVFTIIQGQCEGESSNLSDEKVTWDLCLITPPPPPPNPNGTDRTPQENPDTRHSYLS